MSRVQGNGGTMTERAWRFTQGKGGNYSRPASKSLLPSGRTFPRSSALKAHVRSHSLEISRIWLRVSSSVDGEEAQSFDHSHVAGLGWLSSNGMPRWRLFLKRVSNELNSPSSKSFLSSFFLFFSSSFFILESHRPFPLFDVSSVENVSRGIENPSLLNFVNGRMQDSLRFSSERASISSRREDDEKDRV